jgi:hypothetical protein
MLRGSRGQESSGVRVVGPRVDALSGPDLRQTTQIHHPYVVTDMAHHRKIVSYEEVTIVVLVLKAHEQVDDLGLHRNV